MAISIYIFALKTHSLPLRVLPLALEGAILSLVILWNEVFHTFYMSLRGAQRRGNLNFEFFNFPLTPARFFNPKKHRIIEKNQKSLLLGIVNSKNNHIFGLRRL